jgi:hypothetical protein
MYSEGPVCTDRVDVFVIGGDRSEMLRRFADTAVALQNLRYYDG